MKNKNIKSLLSILAMAVVTLMSSFPAQGQEPVNSNYGGVQIGAITYSFRSIREVDAVLQACVDAGLSSVELMGTGVEAYLGAPENPTPNTWKRSRFGVIQMLPWVNMWLSGKNSTMPV